MLFNGFTYLVFLPVVVLMHWMLPKPFRKTLLLIASYTFYMSWMPVYGLLIAALTAGNYFFGIAIAAAQPQAKKKYLLQAGISLNLLCLCFYKYTNFVISSILDAIKVIAPITGAHALPAITSPVAPVVNIVLPLGISFFTFEFIHYITDVYRGSAPMRNIRDFALFAAFFPTQIAGPIKRFQDFVAQLQKETTFSLTYFQGGIFLILQGLFKKVALGDNLGALVNLGYANVHTLGVVDSWVTAIAFALQLFFDFAGYTDIGRGSALLLGYKVPENFNWPYLAPNPEQFWHRWHMSLSTWLRDYLFIPLGGSRVSKWKLRRNLLVTMVLGGLWHGASWNFFVWGAAHGTGLVVFKEWQSLVTRIPALSRHRTNPLWHWAGVIGMLVFWTLTGVIFRSTTMSEASNMVSNLFFCKTLATAQWSETICGQLLQSTIPAALVIYLIYCVTRYLIERMDESSTLNFLRPVVDWLNRSIPFKMACALFVAVLILGFAPSQITPFIYFQF